MGKGNEVAAVIVAFRLAPWSFGHLIPKRRAASLPAALQKKRRGAPLMTRAVSTRTPRHHRSLDVFAEFHVPVGQVEEMLPTVVVMEAEINLHEGPPLRPFRFADQAQARLLRRAIGLRRVTG